MTAWERLCEICQTPSSRSFQWENRLNQKTPPLLVDSAVNKIRKCNLRCAPTINRIRNRLYHLIRHSTWFSKFLKRFQCCWKTAFWWSKKPRRNPQESFVLCSCKYRPLIQDYEPIHHPISVSTNANYCHVSHHPFPTETTSINCFSWAFLGMINTKIFLIKCSINERRLESPKLEFVEKKIQYQTEVLDENKVNQLLLTRKLMLLCAMFPSVYPRRFSPNYKQQLYVRRWNHENVAEEQRVASLNSDGNLSSPC